MRTETQLLSARSVRRIDIAVAVWIIVWVVMGMLLWSDIRTQAQLSSDVIKVGTAVRDTGQALGVVGGLPLVGERIGEFAGRIETMGREVEVSGQDSRTGVERTAVIAGLCVGILPAALVLLLWVPTRIRWQRYVGAIAAALSSAAGDPALQKYLARRAIDALPWDHLRAISPDPWNDIARGEYAAFAEAELERLGLRR